MKKFILFLCIFFALGFFTARYQSEILSKILKREKTEKKSLDFGFKPSPYPQNNHPFVILIIGRNNGAFLEKTLNSALSQKYDSFRMIYIDDASSDGSARLAGDLIYASSAPCHAQFIENQHPLGTGKNLTRAILSCQDDEIIVLMQGEDLLAHEWVLAKLNQYFADPSLWVSCSKTMEFPSFLERDPPSFSKESFQKETLRETSFSPFYLPCFYAKLFKKIEPSDLSESALSYIAPLLEMAENHFHYIPETLYLTTQTSLPDQRAPNQKEYSSLARLFLAPEEAL